MSKKFEPLAKDIVRLVGGEENIQSMHHCQTRLRFALKDESIALNNQEEISKLDGVMKVLNQGGMFQIVVGMDVASCYEEVVKLVHVTEGEAPEGEKKEKKKIFDVVADFVSSIFSPIVPALAGAGMVKALLSLLIAFNLIDKTNQTYIIINMIGDATFAFLPILLAYTTAKKLNCNPILAAVTVGIMCHATWTGLVGAGEAVKFAGIIPLYLVKYTGSVIPAVLVVLVQAPIEKFLHKHIPGAIRLVFAPMIEFLVMGVLALSIIGPLGDYVGKLFTAAFTFLSDKAGWLECMLMGGLYSTLVIFGLHHGLAPLGTMQMADMGYDGIFGPGVLCANIGQGTASLVTGLLSKDSKTRQIGLSAGVTGLMGTTEPALYGINVPKKFPLIAGAIGAACGGLFAGLTHTHRYATGSSGLPAVVMYIGDDTLKFFYQIIISLAITIVVTAILTVIFYKRAQRKADKLEAIGEKAAPAALTGPQTVAAPVEGIAHPLSEANDEVFSSGAMGNGAMIEPAKGRVVAPCDGEISSLFETGHALGIASDAGAEILIHIGIDTVEMKGKGFKALVKQGARVKQGQPLIDFDINTIKAAGYSTQTMVIVTNTDEYSNVVLAASGAVRPGDPLLKVEA